MNRIAAAALVLVSSLAFAQEIGKEITPDQANTPPPANNPPPSYDNPYAPPPPPPTAPVEPKGGVAAPEKIPGPRRGAFGIRAEMGGQGGSLGLAISASEAVGINLDLGAGFGFNNADFGFNLGVGIDVRMGSAAKPIRPLFVIGATFGKAQSTKGDDFTLAFQIGGGAEYWFSDFFSVNGRLLVGLPIDLSSRGGASIATVTPGIGGTFYF